MSGENSKMDPSGSREELMAMPEDFEREKRRQRRERERRKRKRQMIKRMLSVIGYLFLLAGLAIFLFWYVEFPHKTTSDGFITRDFTNKMFFIPKIPTDGRDVAWDSELPGFIEKDIKEAKNKDYKIRYTVGNSSLEISFYNEETLVEVRSSYSWALPSFNTLSNFSIYKKGNNLYLYGYNEDYSDNFQRYILYSDYSKYPNYDSLTYDTNLPLSLESKGIGSLELGDYSMCYDDEKTFYFYKDGKEVSSKSFSDSISEVHQYDGLLITTNNMLYIIYAYEKDGVPDLKFVYITDGVEYAKTESSYFNARLTATDSKSLPILMRDNVYYTLVPNNWEDYNDYCISNSNLKPYDRDTDYSVTLINLEDAFVSAKFEYGYSEWNVEIAFNINGKIYTTDDYALYGYDTRIHLSDEDAQKLSVTVKSIEDFKEHIQTIRDAYPSYYTTP